MLAAVGAPEELREALQSTTSAANLKLADTLRRLLNLIRPLSFDDETILQ